MVFQIPPLKTYKKSNVSSAGDFPHCATLPLEGFSRPQPQSILPKIKLVSQSSSLRKSVGGDPWAVVRLDFSAHGILPTLLKKNTQQDANRIKVPNHRCCVLFQLFSTPACSKRIWWRERPHNAAPGIYIATHNWGGGQIAWANIGANLVTKQKCFLVEKSGR